MTTTIHSNGSKWAGQAPDSVEKLLSVLASTPLDPSFEDYGDFQYPNENAPGTIRFFGNFYAVSHVFSIDTDDPSTISALSGAIAANKATREYQEAKGARMAGSYMHPKKLGQD